ncbi:_partial [Hexamita inflata]|uniref:Partial n=1 Tax=Hexamita inflata TaxID=28002 RepID=A0AA86U842_9EUKA|nr:betatubulin [Hexamita inflata]
MLTVLAKAILIRFVCVIQIYQQYQYIHIYVCIIINNLCYLLAINRNQRTQSASSSTTERVHHLKDISRIRQLILFSNSFHHRVNYFCTFSIVAFRPVVTSSINSRDNIFWLEETSNIAFPDLVQNSWFKVHEHAPGYVSTVGHFLEIYTLVSYRFLWISQKPVVLDLVLQHGPFPESGCEVVSALANLNGQDFSHQLVWQVIS